MTKEDIKTFLMIITTLIVPVLSLGIILPYIKIIFVLIYICICFLVLSKLFDDKLKMKKVILFIAIGIEILFIVISAFNAGSIISFTDRIKSFFAESPDKSSNNPIPSDIDFETYFNNLGGQISDIKNSIDGIENNVVDIDKNIYLLTSNMNDYDTENVDEIEIEEILEKMEENYYKHKSKNNFFDDLKTDKYLIEIFYKMYISDISFHYCNIIEAFNKYGIDTQKLNIKISDLIIWDLERLYATYNMKNSIVNELDSDEIIDEKIFYYNDYKVSFQKYSDDLDYYDWGRSYTEVTAKKIDNTLNNTIMDYYKKFITNFSSE